MRLTPSQVRTLLKRVHPNRVKSRSQGGTNLSYLEAWDVKASLIRVFGFAGFSADVIETEILHREQVPKSSGNGTNWKIAARSRVRLTLHDPEGHGDVTYTEDAIAGSIQPDITEALDMAQKSASSDALKRAAIYLGTQFGLSLYNGQSPMSEVVGVVYAPGQTADEIAEPEGVKDPPNPGAAPDMTEDHKAAAAAAVARAQAGPPRRSRS